MRETGYAIHMTTQSTIRALTKLEFAYGLATRMAELIGDAFARDDGDAGRARLLRAPDRQCAGAVAGAGLGARRRGVVSQRRRARADALDAAGLDAAGGRDHHADRQPQPADDAQPRSARRPRRCGR